MAEQVNPNALGAPAEGFGQTVSFAFDPRGEAPMMRPVTSQPRGGGVSGGANQQAINPNSAYDNAPKADPTGALLLKVGEDILNKKLDEQRTVKFVEGMQQAMNGAAIKDVVESVPWYAKLFGDTPVIEGARAYTAASKVNESVTAAMAQMPALQELSGPDAAKHFSGMVNGNLTGDGGTDAVIMKGMTEQLPSLMKAQAKAHYGWNQKVAMQAYSKHMITAAKTMQTFGEHYANDMVTDEDMAVQKQTFAQSVMAPAGLDEENGVKTLVGNMQGMALAGQFHALAALKDSGALFAMTPEQANRVEGAITTAANKYRNNYANRFAGEIAELKSDAAVPYEGMGEAEKMGAARLIEQRIDAMNTKYRKATGSPVDLFTSDEKADMLKGTFNALKAEQAKAAAAQARLADSAASGAEKLQAKADLDGVVEKMVADGNYAALQITEGVSSDMIDRATLAFITNNPDKKEQTLSQGFIKGNYVNNVIKQQLQQPLKLSEGSGAPTNEWYFAVADFEAKRGSAGSLPYAQAYYGDYAVKLQQASTMLSGQGIGHPQAGAIWQAVMGGTMKPKRDPLTTKEATKLVGDVANLNSNPLVRMFTGATKLRGDTLKLMAEVATESTENWRTTDLTDEQAVSMGLVEAARSGKLEIIGGFGIRNYDKLVDGKPPVSLKALASKGGQFIPADKADSYFDAFMHEAKVIPREGTTQMHRVGEAGGTANYRVSWMSDDGGEQRSYAFTAAEWQQFAQFKTKQDTAKPAPLAPGANGTFQFGPKITYPRGSADIYGPANQRIVDTVKGMGNSTPKGAKLYPEQERVEKQAEAAKRNQLN